MALTTITNIAIPALVFLMMTVVGMELLPRDFSRVRQRPRAVLIGTLGQLLMLPPLALLIGWVLRLPVELIAGMVLVAACPGGALSNYYAWLARADVALSVTLTGVSTLLVAFTLPWVANVGFRLIALDHGGLSLPITATIIQLLWLLALPVALGMSLRHWLPRWTQAHDTGLRLLSLLALIALLGFICWQQTALLLQQAAALVLAGVSFTLLSLFAGMALAALFQLPNATRFSIGIEHAARNLGVAVVVGAGVLGDTGMVVFAATRLLVQTPLLLAAALLQRHYNSNNAAITGA